jgi:hypothetical protein
MPKVVVVVSTDPPTGGPDQDYSEIEVNISSPIEFVVEPRSPKPGDLIRWSVRHKSKPAAEFIIEAANGGVLPVEPPKTTRAEGRKGLTKVYQVSGSAGTYPFVVHLEGVGTFGPLTIEVLSPPAQSV